MYIDEHAHLLSSEYGEDLEKEINLIKNSEVILVNNVGYNIESSLEAVRLSKKHPFLFATIGIHPYDANNFNKENLEKLVELSKNEKVLVIGEIGLDYFRNITDFDLQKKVFREQLQLAKSLKLPFMIHSRDAFNDTINIIKEVGYFNGIFHSFDYGEEEIKEILDTGLYVSFSGMLTFKKREKLRRAAMIAPIEQVLLETDSPYLTPVPFRGKKNTPLFVKYVYEKFASLKNIDENDLCNKITENFKRLFVKSTNYLNNQRR